MKSIKLDKFYMESVKAKLESTEEILELAAKIFYVIVTHSKSSAVAA